jgi:mono/diheme cytochrome c family protein
MAPPLVPTQRSAEALIEIVRTGRGVMPPLDPSLIADDEVAEVAAFLRSLSQ